MINIVLFGPPGAGKGTQSQYLIEKYKLLHIAPGNMFREEIKKNTPLGQELASFINQGKLVPADKVIEAVQAKINHTTHKNGLLLDGFPRSLKQAESLTELLYALNQKVDLAIFIEVKEEELQKRIAYRRQVENRADDHKLMERLQIYQQYKHIILNYYKTQGNLVTIDGEGTVEKVADDIDKLVQKLTKP